MFERPTAKKSLLISYLLLFCFGWFGIHRFYLGKWLSGFIYLGTFGLLGIGVLLDIFILPSMVREADEHPEAIIPISFNLFTILFSQSNAEDLAVWAQQPQSSLSRLLDLLDNIVRIIFFLMSPMLVIMFSMYISGSQQMAFFTVAIVILAGYMGNIRRILQSFQHTMETTPALSKVPFLSDVVKNVSEFYNYYAAHKPYNILLYTFYPALIFLSFFHKPLSEELNLYRNLLLLILFTVVLNTLFSYSTVYLPYLTIWDAVFSILFSLTMVLIILMTLLMPTITTSLKFRLSGKRKTLTVITTLALLFAVAGYQSDSVPFENIITITNSFNLENKMKKAKFREDLEQLSEMFLVYHKPRLATPPVPITVNETLTTAYRKHIQSVAVPNENQSFTVFTFTQDSQVWLGVHYAKIEFGQINIPDILVLIDAAGTLHTHWATLPPTVQQRFTLLEHPKQIDEKTYTFDKITHFQLNDDIQTQ